MRKFTVQAKPSPWLTDYIRALMKMRDMAKLEAKKSGFPSDWVVYRKLRIMWSKLTERVGESMFKMVSTIVRKM